VSDRGRHGGPPVPGRDAAPDPIEVAEASEGSLPPDPELEAALREAMASVERTEAEATPVAADPVPGPDAGAGGAPAEAPSAEAAASAELASVRDKLLAANERLLRLQADFENYRKRAAREHQDALQFGPQNLVKDLLPVVDNLDRAIRHARQSAGGNLQGLLQGVELVQRELQSVLAKHHVIEIDALGKPFNPALHEAMAQITDEASQPNSVVDVLEKGYQLRDRLLRPAKVVVNRAAAGGSGGSGEGEAPA
jgi:molecular chaperone GrpE